ncbi:YeeE/YedE family protein [Roseivivax sp. CAU 1761]
MLDFLGERGALVAIGFAGGLLLGVAARGGRFCTLGAIEDLHFGRTGSRMRMWGVALGCAVALVFGAAMLGWVDPAQSVYLSTSSGIAAALVGGALFGTGMALSGNCGYGALARLGGGEMRAFVIVLVMGLAAMATLSGPLAGLRLALFPELPTAAPYGMAHGLARASGLPVNAIGLVIGLGILAASCYRAVSLRIFWGLPVGLAIASGYVGCAYVARHGFDPVAITSHSFAAPLGETMIYVMLSSGVAPTFGVGSVAGILVGAFLASSARGVFRWEACDDHRELRRQIGGAVLMGIGAVIAMGCSIGQGLSAFAVLGVTAPITLAAIWTAAALTLRVMIEGRLFPFAQ